MDKVTRELVEREAFLSEEQRKTGKTIQRRSYPALGPTKSETRQESEKKKKKND